MIATRLAFIALSLFSFTSITLPTAALAAPAVKRDNADIQTILTTFKASTDEFLPQIDAFVASGDTSSASLDPLFGSVQDAINTAISSVESLPAPTVRAKRQTEDALAALVASIITDINNTLTSANAAAAPTGFPIIITDFTTAIDKLLIDLDIYVPDILDDVVVILDDVVGVVVALLFELLGGL